MVKELTSFWTLISKEKFLHEIIKTLTDWISENCESPMVLLVSHTGMETMSSADFQQNLKLLETCVELYFKRLLNYFLIIFLGTLSCEWEEISHWINVPEKSKELLYATPK